MARQRRGGFRPPELRGTLGTLLRTTLAQAGVVRDALERGAREGRSRLDDALSNRRRSDALAELGEIVLDLIRRGEIDVDELPEVRDVVDHLDSLDAGHPDDEQDEPPPAAPRKRFDARARDRDHVETEPPPTRRRAAPRDAEDGTVSSKTWAPKRSAGAARVWRPPADVEIVAAPVDDEEPLPAAAKKPPRKGGISFGNADEDDSDLAEYMHPDDVPPKSK